VQRDTDALDAERVQTPLGAALVTTPEQTVLDLAPPALLGNAEHEVPAAIAHLYHRSDPIRLEQLAGPQRPRFGIAACRDLGGSTSVNSTNVTLSPPSSGLFGTGRARPPHLPSARRDRGSIRRPRALHRRHRARAHPSPHGRLSKDIDLAAVDNRTTLAAELDVALERAVARTYGRLVWQPALTAVKDTQAASLRTASGLSVKVQLLSSRNRTVWPA
jgi:hypothetical protein